MKYNKSEFDSKIFGKNWYRLDISDEKECNAEKILDAIRNSDAEYIDIKITGEQLKFERKLKEIGFRKVCMQISMCCELIKQNIEPSSVTTFSDKPLDENIIKKLSENNSKSFTTSRFYLDEKLNLENVFEFQRQWIRNSLEDYNMLKFIYRDSFLTVKQIGKNIKTDLIAVPIQDRNKGIGGKLFTDAIGYSKGIGCEEMWATISTENLPTYRMHTKVGFEVRSFISCLNLDVEDLINQRNRNEK